MSQLIGQGGTITLDADFTDGTGAAVDPTTPRVSIINALGATVVSNATPTRISLGHYEYAYPVDVAAPLGAWDADWTALINGSPVEAHDGFTVVPAGTVLFTSTDAFVTIADYEAAFNTVITGDAGLTAKVQFALDSACAEIRQALGNQTLTYVTDDVIELDGTGRTALLLPQLPVVHINSVTIDKGLATELAVTDWVLGLGGVLRRKGTQLDPTAWYTRRPPKVWPWGFGNITVDYDHGYDAYESEPFPKDLINVALQVARSTVSSLPAGITSETIGGYSYTRQLGATLGADAYEKLLNRYAVKRVPVP
jgi:hypothetical protein